MRTPRFLLLIFASAALACSSPALATTYYVDSVSGSDGNLGTSPAAAWQTLAKVNATTFAPADHILFKADCVWSGQLWPKGSGSAGNAIIIDMYDTGAKPLINGEGAAQEALLLYNQQYWEVNNLEITNYDPAGPDVNPYRQGVRVLGEDVGVLNHIYLLDLEVHDVNGSITDDGRNQGKCNAGILYDVEGDSTPTYFNDILIESCYIHDCQRSGIKLWTDWGRSCNQASPSLHTNVVIRSNIVDNIAGDGINIHQTAGALAEYNVVSRSCHYTEKANAALWTWASDDAIIQYNEVYDSMQTWDGMAFDIDGCSQRCIYQYNYSHDNWGGFLMIIGVPDCIGGGPYSKFCNDNHFRYNISQNDQTRIYRVFGKVWDNYIYNNTAYLDDSDPHWVEGGSCGSPAQWPDSSYFWNNIFYNTNSTGADFTLGSCTNTVFDYNVFYGNHHATEPADPHKLTSDPRLVAPGTASIGRETCDGYKLMPNSPCIDSGLTIPDSGGLDFWGNPVPFGPATDRGASEYSLTPPQILLEVHPNERALGAPPSISMEPGGPYWQWLTPASSNFYTWKEYHFSGSGNLWIQVCAQNFGSAQNKSVTGIGAADKVRLIVDGITPADVWGIQSGTVGGPQWNGNVDQGKRLALEFLCTGLTPGLHQLVLQAQMSPIIYWIKVHDLEPRYVE